MLALIGSNIVVLALTGYSLFQTKQEYELRAAALSQIVASAIDQNVTRGIEKIDLALFDLKYEAEHQLATKNGLDPAALIVLMSRVEQYLPEVENFRIVDAQGRIVMGNRVSPGDEISVADREYFVNLRNRDEHFLEISKPLMGRVIQQPLIVLGLRLNDPDGNFAGIVYATVVVDYFRKLLANFDLGAHGSISLRDRGFGLIARWPVVPDQPAGEVGNRLGSPELVATFESGATSATFLNSGGGDGIRRMVTFHRLSKAPMMVAVGVASRDYLAALGGAIFRDVAIVLSFLGMTLLFRYLILRLMSRTEQSEAARQEMLGRLQKIARRVPGVVFQYRLRSDASSCFPFASEGIREIYRVSPEDVRNDASKAFARVHPDDACSFMASIKNSARDLTPWRHEYRVRFEDGSTHWLFGNAMPERAEDGSVLWHGVITNVSERKKLEHDLEQERARLHTLVNTIPDLVWLKNPDGVYLDCNPEVARYIGATTDEIIGKTDYDFFPREQADAFRKNDLIALSTPTSMLSEEWLTKASDGSSICLEIIKTPMLDAGQNLIGVLCVARDVTVRKQLEDQARQLAFYDGLTNLPNRRMLNDRMSLTLAANKRSERYGALMFIDLDNFKPLNDAHGHEAGDLLLVEVGQRLKSSVREMDTVARIGGDEFVVLVGELERSRVASMTQAADIAEKIRLALSMPYAISTGARETIEHHCTASMGVVIFSSQETSQEQILRWADAAMYQAKDAGCNTVRFHEATVSHTVLIQAT